MTPRTAVLYTLFAGANLLPGARAWADNGTNTVEDEVRLLREQNALLQRQVVKQGTELDSLSKKVQTLEAAGKSDTVTEGDNSAPPKGGFNLGNVNISAEGGVGFFTTGKAGFAPDSNFRVDESRIFVEAPVWNTVYFFGSVDQATRESTSLNTELGELYLDFEDASQLWGKDGQLNVRAGRMKIPFGEEYVNRYAMENPLISHSLTDLWGIDPGVELYGKLGKFCYVAAVQNGGGNGVQDFDADKSVTGRIGYDPNAHWHFSVSAMRTGELDVKQDFSSELWFGSGFFVPIGAGATKFHANLVEGDAAFHWKSGHVSAFGGYARFSDNDRVSDDTRNIIYYSVEAQQKITRKIYLAARFSQIFTGSGGYTVVGFGDINKFLMNDPVTEIWRASLGIGYSFSDNLALKLEYSFENGDLVGGGSRDDENFFGTEAVFKF